MDGMTSMTSVGAMQELMSKLGDLPKDSAAVQAGQAFVDAVLADVRAGGHVGKALMTALNAARDPSDALYKGMSMLERTMAVTVANTIAKSLEA